MKVEKIKLLPKSQVKLIYKDGKEEIRKARGMLMKPWGVKESLKGRKTQTRRIINPQPKIDDVGNFIWGKWNYGQNYGKPLSHKIIENCRYGKPMDLFYIKERVHKVFQNSFIYKMDTDINDNTGFDWKWKSSLFMPRIAARIWFEITDIRVERIQDISETDAQKEGVNRSLWYITKDLEYINLHGDLINHNSSYTNDFANIWDKINRKRGYGWDVNPWCWVIEYREIFIGRGEV